MNKLARVGLLFIVLGASCTALLAEEPAADQKKASGDEVKAPFNYPRTLGIAGTCLGAAIAAVGGGYAISRIGGKCIEAIARQPEAGGAMFAPMVVSVAMVESGMLFAIVVAMIGILKL